MMASTTSTGGYDYQLTGYINPIDESSFNKEHKCPICAKIPRKPQQAICCGQVYCKSCLTSDNPSNCRCCHGELKYFYDKRADLKIQSLQVYCPNKERGCQWYGELQNVTNHIAECPHQLEPCRLCGEEIQLRFIVNHRAINCPHAWIKCNFCSTENIRQYITGEHVNECPHYVVPCSHNECNWQLPRSQITEHERSCPHKIVHCEYGCQEEMKLKDLDKHNRDYSHNHLVFGLREIAERRAVIERRLEEIEGGYRDIIGYRGHPPMRMKDFDQMKNENKGWLSPCFYSSPRGYKMALVIYSNGINQGFGSHLSCFACFLSGEHDDGLQWPFRGKITITLLNQLMDRYHKRLQITLTNNTPPSQTIIEGQPCDIFGESQFIPHSQLRVNSFGNCQYLKDDSLYFRVNVEVISDTRPWLAHITYH